MSLAYVVAFTLSFFLYLVCFTLNSRLFAALLISLGSENYFRICDRLSGRLVAFEEGIVATWFMFIWHLVLEEQRKNGLCDCSSRSLRRIAPSLWNEC
jgi:hypothetical protein